MNQDITEVIPIFHFDDADYSGLPFKISELELPTNYLSNTAHRHNYYEVFLFEEGGGEHIIDFHSYPIVANAIHLVFPGQIHKVDRKPETKGRVITFTEDFIIPSNDLVDLVSNLSAHKNCAETITLSKPEFDKVSNLVNHLFTEMDNCHMDCRPAIRSFLYIILYKYYLYRGEQKTHVPASMNVGRLFTKFKSLLEENFRDWHMPSQYTDTLNVSLKVLNHECNLYSGKNASDLIRERIILEAKRLLFNTDLMSKEIAYKLKFDDPAHFSKFFKQYTGLSIKEYKEDVQRKYK